MTVARIRLWSEGMTPTQVAAGGVDDHLPAGHVEVVVGEQVVHVLADQARVGVAREGAG